MTDTNKVEPVAWFDDVMDSAYTSSELDGGSVNGLEPLYLASALAAAKDVAWKEGYKQGATDNEAATEAGYPSSALEALRQENERLTLDVKRYESRGNQYLELRTQLAAAQENNAELERLCDETYVAKGADAYDHACEVMEQYQQKRHAAGKEVGTINSLCDGMAWVYLRLDETEAQLQEAQAERDLHYNRCASLLFSDALCDTTAGDIRKWAAEYVDAKAEAARYRNALVGMMACTLRADVPADIYDAAESALKGDV